MNLTKKVDEDDRSQLGRTFAGMGGDRAIDVGVNVVGMFDQRRTP